MNLHFTWGGGGDLGEKISDITNTGTKVAKRTSGGGGGMLFWIYNDVRYRNCTWSGKITNIAEEVSDRMDLI